MAEEKKAKEALEALLNLMTGRPELPIVPMVFMERCPEEYMWYKGHWGPARITKFVESDERIYFYDEKDMEDCLCDFYGWDYEEWSDEKALEAYKALNWTECIAVYIDED